MISPFLNQILVNFKKSNNLFFTNNDKKFTYNESYKRLLSFNNFFKNYKKYNFQINQLIIMLLFWYIPFGKYMGANFTKFTYKKKLMR